MAGTLTTNNPQGLGYQQGYFSGPVGTPIDQDFFDLAFAGRINENKIYKEAYYCNIVGDCTMSTWLEEFGGVEYSCYPEYTLLEYTSVRHQIRAAANTTIPAAPATGTITLSAKDHFVSGAYVLPQVGNTIVLTPSGQLAEVTLVTHATANDTVITVRQRGTAGAQNVLLGDEMLVLAGRELDDCECPEGQFNLRDLPTEIDLNMANIALKGELCGDALEKCQWLKIPFLDEAGNPIDEKGKWYTEAQRDMFRDLEHRKHYEILLNPNFGLVTQLRARGIKFNPTSSTEITTDDVRDWKQELDKAGITQKEFAIFAGREIYSQFQRMLLEAGVVQLDTTLQPLGDCKWLNMEWCGIKVEGLILHIFEDCSFSNGKALGSQGMIFPNSAIIVPMGNRQNEPSRSINERREYRYGSSTEKMFNIVYFQSINGRKYDMFVDSNGILNGPNGRNTFGTGCRQHEWSANSRLTLEAYCLSSWGYIGL